MTTALGEVIQLLSFEGSVFPGQTYITEKVLIQEFCSMSVTINSTENASFRISFSNNGVDFDYNSTTTIPGNDSQTISTVVLGKWVRLRYLNAGIAPAILRFSTYCQVNPIALQTQLEKEGNQFPSVNVDNLTGSLINDLRVSQEKVIHQHKFDYGRIQGNVLVDPDRGYFQFNGGGIVPALTVPSIDAGVYSLYDIFKSGLNAYIGLRGPSVVYVVGNPFIVTFSAKFDISGYTNADVLGVDNMLVGAGWVSLGQSPDPAAGVMVDGLFVGYPKAPRSPDTIVRELSLVYYNNGFEQYVPQSRWLFDTLDGNGNSGVTLDSSKMGTWRIRTAYSAYSIYLEFQNPIDNIWIPCHRIALENLSEQVNFHNPSFSAMIYARRTSVASGVGSKVAGPGLGSISLGLENAISSKVDTYTYGIDAGLVSIPTNTETELISLRAGELINTKVNRTVVILMTVSLSTDGTKPCVFKMYRNGGFVGASWTYHNPNNSPVQILTGGSAVVPSGEVVIGQYAGKEDSSSLEIDKLKIFMDYADTLTITAESSGSSDIRLFLNYGLIR